MAEVAVGAGECVDAVVVFGVGEGGQLVEELAVVLAADEADEAVFGCCCDGAGTYFFGAAWPARSSA